MRPALVALLCLVACTGGDPSEPDAGDGGTGDGTDGTAACEVPTTWFRDFDGDGYGNADRPEEGCAPPEPDGWVEVAGDCDDGDASINPGRPDDDCDGVDNDCDGTVDPVRDTFHDLDGDGHGGEFAGTTCWDLQPDDTRVYIDGDCDDDDPMVFPGQVEWYGDSVDSNCDGELEGACGEGSGSVEMDHNDPNAVTDQVHAVAWFTGDGGICSMDCGDADATRDEEVWWSTHEGCTGTRVELPLSPNAFEGVTLCATNTVEGERFTIGCGVYTESGILGVGAGSYPAR